MQPFRYLPGRLRGDITHKHVIRIINILRKHACFCRYSPQWVRTSSFTRFLDHTQRSTTVGRTPLNEWSLRRRDFYLTKNNDHNRQTSMPPVGFFLCKMIHLLSSDLEIQTYMIKVHFVCQNYKKKTASRTHNLSVRATVDLRLRPHGHWYRNIARAGT